ncbi:MAG: hypothetical protein J7515_08715, partial [Caulobacter sp.]|nr:hypothetical protein [Caulobacter sp.]
MSQGSLQHRTRRTRPGRAPRLVGGPAGALAAALLACQPALADMPRLETQGSAQRLVVDGKPLLVLGGELG